MLIRVLGVLTLLLLSIGSANAAACGPDTAPAIAAAQGLTCEVFVDTFTDTSSIDTGDTLNPASCSGATFPNGVCHWFVHNAWPNAANNCGTCAGGLQPQTYPASTTFDYSTSGSGLLLQPQQLTVTANTVAGSNQLTNISNVTGVATLGNAIVFGPGIPWSSSTSTAFTLSGTTATMTANATSTNTGATYVLGNVHNGWMMQSCGYSPTGSGFVGTAFTGNMYVQITATLGTQGPNLSANESEPEMWTWPAELFVGPRPTGGNLLNIMEMDFFDTNPTQRVIYNESVDNTGDVSFVFGSSFGGPYYGYSVARGSSPYGMLVMNPASNAGGANIGIVSVDSGGSVYNTLSYGPSITPSTSPSGSIAGSAPSGAFTLLPSLHYCLQMTAAPDFPMTVQKVAVWQAAPSTSAGGRRGLFR